MNIPLAGGKPVEILVAEDSATQAQRLRYILEQKGYRVIMAANGLMAMEAARRSRPTLVISDVVMPEMDGYELCRSIKDDEQLGDVPVILVTTLADPQDVIKGLECRADQFILKPYDEQHLLNRIQFVLVNREIHGAEFPGMGLEIYFNGQRHFITADRLQILNLLLSTYEAAIHRNRELTTTQDALRLANSELQVLTRELEDRVQQRTHELEKANEDLRRTQQAVMQQERLRALGQMASGIAHDINNAISPIVLYTESMLERERGLSDEARGRLETIQRAINDVAQTVSRMREFYRQRETQVQLTAVNLNEMVRQVLDLTHARWRDTPLRRGVQIELKMQLADDLPEVQAAENEIRDALTNLVFNAVDAMPQGGTLGIRTYVAAADEISGRTVLLEVSDSGLGMDEETRRRCLEPFFTTKGDRGTGLGLPMVYGMAKRHGAQLEIDSSIGKGTTMRLRYPMGDRTIAETVRVAVPSLRPRPLRLLVIDDDPVLLQSLQDSLEGDGHSVTAAKGGQAGIDAFAAAKQSGEAFDAVITDLGMPQVDGRKVIGGVRALSAGTPIILLTGWGQQPLAEDGAGPKADHVLSKPPRIRELRETLLRCCGHS
jgi:signal transduction histidine kinase